MYAARFAPYQAKNIRYAHRAQLPGLRADLHRDGILVARVSIPDGDTAVEHEFLGEAYRYTYDRDMAALDPNFFGESLADVDSLRAWFIVQLLKATHQDDQLRSLCATGTVFRLRGDIERVWRVTQEPFTLAAAVALRETFGGGLATIANESLAAPM